MFIIPENLPSNHVTVPGFLRRSLFSRCRGLLRTFVSIRSHSGPSAVKQTIRRETFVHCEHVRRGSMVYKNKMVTRCNDDDSPYFVLSIKRSFKLQPPVLVFVVGYAQLRVWLMVSTMMTKQSSMTYLILYLYR